MRVTDAYRPPVTSTSTAQGPAAAQPASPQSQAAPDARESVKLKVSDKAVELAHAARQDEARVEQLRRALAEGTFRVDATAIAGKIVGDDG
jgi:flagellar biosynthesis anti-sigma factor FlgM